MFHKQWESFLKDSFLILIWWTARFFLWTKKWRHLKSINNTKEAAQPSKRSLRRDKLIEILIDYEATSIGEQSECLLLGNLFKLMRFEFEPANHLSVDGESRLPSDLFSLISFGVRYRRQGRLWCAPKLSRRRGPHLNRRRAVQPRLRRIFIGLLFRSEKNSRKWFEVNASRLFINTNFELSTPDKTEKLRDDRAPSA